MTASLSQKTTTSKKTQRGKIKSSRARTTARHHQLVDFHSHHQNSSPEKRQKWLPWRSRHHLHRIDTANAAREL